MMQPPTDPHQKTVELSSREEEVLRLIALGSSYKEIAAELNIGVKTVESYRYRACEKLELKSRSEIIRYAGLRGWLNNS